MTFESKSGPRQGYEGSKSRPRIAFGIMMVTAAFLSNRFMNRLGINVELWQTLFAAAALVISLADLEETRKQTDEYKISEAVKRFLRPFDGGVSSLRCLVPRPKLENTLKEIIKFWDGRTTLVSGLFGSGKTIAIRQALAGLPGVIEVRLPSGTTPADVVCARLGLSSEASLQTVLKELKKQLPDESLNQAPILVLDIPRHSKVDMTEVGTFAKQYAFDDELAHVIVVGSSATVAARFDAGGSARKQDVWVGDLEDQEAECLLQHFNVPSHDWDGILKELGKNALVLREALRTFSEKNNMVTVINAKYQERYSEVIRLMRASLTVDNAPVQVGQEILEALLLQPQGVGHDTWDLKKIQQKQVASMISQIDAHAIYFHSVDKEWRFTSPQHHEAFKKLNTLVQQAALTPKEPKDS